MPIESSSDPHTEHAGEDLGDGVTEGQDADTRAEVGRHVVEKYAESVEPRAVRDDRQDSEDPDANVRNVGRHG